MRRLRRFHSASSTIPADRRLRDPAAGNRVLLSSDMIERQTFFDFERGMYGAGY
jgi:hypothetical protein